jgi:hypothetical protein
MPIALDPDTTFPVALASDADKPEAERPVFLFRALTCRQLRKVQDLREKARQAKDNGECERLVDEALAVGLTGWRNMGDVAFSLEAIDDLLTWPEKWELLDKYPAAVILGETDRKNLRSPSPTTEAISADTATATSAESPQPAPSS